MAPKVCMTKLKKEMKVRRLVEAAGPHSAGPTAGCNADLFEQSASSHSRNIRQREKHAWYS